MRYVYIAGPYTRDDPVINTARVVDVADYLMICGYIPYVPHLTLFWHFKHSHSIKFWYDYDLAWLEKCDCLLRLPGESSGADKEVMRALELGLPVYLSLDELLLREKKL